MDQIHTMKSMNVRTAQKFLCVRYIFFVVCGVVVCTCAHPHLWHTRHAPHEQTRHEHILSYNHQTHVAHHTISSSQTQVSLLNTNIITAASHLYNKNYECNNLNSFLTNHTKFTLQKATYYSKYINERNIIIIHIAFSISP